MLLIALLLVATWLRVHRLLDLPPGLHYDEAANGILASEIAFKGFRPIFITSYTGKEVLYFYLAGGLMRLIGDSIFALRLTSAFIGLVTISVTYWLAREIGRTIPNLLSHKLLKPFALTSAALLAFHFPHILFSRLGFRAISQPLLQALVIATLLYALRKNSQRAFALAGVWLGLAAYTYLAVRLFPFVVLLFMLPLLRQHWRNLALTIGAATLTLLPFAIFFVQNPDTFWVRITQVSAEAFTLGDYANSYWESLGILLGYDGDPYWRFNIPEQPLLGFLSILWPFGLGALLFGRNRTPAHSAITWLLWSVPFIMILPTALALSEIVPSNLRAIGLYPFIFFPPALIMLRMGIGLYKRWPQVAIILLLIVGVVFLQQGYDDYFVQWAGRADAFYDSDSDLVAASDFIDELDGSIYLGALHYRHPTIAFTSERYDDVKWLVQSEALVIPSEPATVVYPTNSPAPAWVADFLGEPKAIGDSRFGQVYAAYELNGRVPVAEFSAENNFSNIIELIGYDLDNATTTQPTLRLHWRVLNTTDRAFTPFIHLIDDTDFRWAQQEFNPYPSEQWAIGETIIQDVTLNLPAAMPQGEFTAVVGFFDGNDRLPLIDEAGRFAGNTVQLSIKLDGNPDAPSKALPQAIDMVLDDATLVGVEIVGSNSAETGTSLPVQLHWQHDQDLNYELKLAPLTPEVTMAEGYGLTPFGSDVFLLARYESIGIETTRHSIIRHAPKLPTNVPSGTYDLHVVTQDGNIKLGSIWLVATERQFDAPQMQFVTDAQFGDSITLLGYNLSDDLKLSLVWKAEAAPERDYTVFVHALNPDGTCCAWQQDSQPAQGSYPTSRWIEDEIVVDEYQLAFDPENDTAYPLEIGLYIAETGQRLIVSGIGLESQDYLFLEPLIINK